MRGTRVTKPDALVLCRLGLSLAVSKIPKKDVHEFTASKTAF